MFSFKRIILSLRAAGAGIVLGLKREHNLRVHAVAIILVGLAGYWCQITVNQWLVVILVITLVVSLELVNAGGEHLIDLLAPRWHAQAAAAKDLLAGAVLVASVSAVIVGTIIFWPYLVKIVN